MLKFGKQFWNNLTNPRKGEKIYNMLNAIKEDWIGI